MSGSMIKRRSDDAFFKPQRQFKGRDSKGWPIGKKTKMGMAGNRKLNKLPREITHACEVHIHGVCIGNRYLTWSHAVKRRFLTTAKDYLVAARSCMPCHTYCEEKMSHKKREAFIKAVIAKRKPHAHTDDT